MGGEGVTGEVGESGWYEGLTMGRVKSASYFCHTRASPVAASPGHGCAGFSNLPKKKPKTGIWQCFLSIPSACLGAQGLAQAPGMGKVGNIDKMLTVRGGWGWGAPLKRSPGEETCLERGTDRSRALACTKLLTCVHPGACYQYSWSTISSSSAFI